MNQQGSSAYVNFASANGDTIGAQVAVAETTTPTPGIVLVPGVTGVGTTEIEMAERLAGEGFSAAFLDIYAREESPDLSTVQSARAVIRHITDSQVMDDMAGAASYLRELPQCDGRVGLVGFCAGGRYVTLFISHSDACQAAVSCHGIIMPDKIGTPETRPFAPIDLVERVSVPLLGLYGAEDTFPSPEDVQRYDEALTAHGKAHEFHTYPGAAHSFLDHNADSYRREAAEDAWRRIRDWINAS
jgi:carboxymethylenebutenolidase